MQGNAYKTLKESIANAPVKICFEIEEYWKNFLSMIDIINHQTLMINKDLNKYAKKLSQEGDIYSSATRFIFNDWIGPNLGYSENKTVLSNGVIVDKESYLLNLERRSEWIYKLSYAQCYEEFERFWKYSTHYYLFTYKPNDHSKFYQKDHPFSVTHFKANEGNFLLALKIINRPLYTTFNRTIHIRSIYKALSAIRNAIIHSQGKLRENDIKSNLFLKDESFFVFEKFGDYSYVSMPEIQYRHALKKLVELGFMFKNFFFYTI